MPSNKIKNMKTKVRFAVGINLLDGGGASGVIGVGVGSVFGSDGFESCDIGSSQIFNT